MSNIIVAFPKMEVAMGVKKILAQSGYTVTSVATSGSAALTAIGRLDHSILVCGARFSDMMYSEIYEYLENDNQMLLIASPQAMMDKPKDLVALEQPLKVHELLETVRMMDESLYRLRRRQRKKPRVRSEADQALIDEAKQLLMDRNKMSEEEAHRYIQKRSMGNGSSLVETAQMIVALNK